MIHFRLDLDLNKFTFKGKITLKRRC